MIAVRDGYCPDRIAAWLHRELDLDVVKHQGVWALRSYDGIACFHKIPGRWSRVPTLSEALSALAGSEDWRATRMAA